MKHLENESQQTKKQIFLQLFFSFGASPSVLQISAVDVSSSAVELDVTF